jgi:hypothetical protein
LCSTATIQQQSTTRIREINYGIESRKKNSETYNSRSYPNNKNLEKNKFMAFSLVKNRLKAILMYYVFEEKSSRKFIKL